MQKEIRVRRRIYNLKHRKKAGKREQKGTEVQEEKWSMWSVAEERKKQPEEEEEAG